MHRSLSQCLTKCHLPSLPTSSASAAKFHPISTFATPLQQPGVSLARRVVLYPIGTPNADAKVGL